MNPVVFDPTTWNWHDPTTWFLAAYTIARLGSHVVKPYTVVGKIFSWILGNVPHPPDNANTVTQTSYTDHP